MSLPQSVFLQTVDRTPRLQTGRILKMLKYIALLLLCNLAISVLGEFEAEEPLDRGKYCLGLKAVRQNLKAVLN